MDQPPLNPTQADAALRILRAGDTATAAAQYAGVKPAAVYAQALHDPDFLLALAGHDPFAYEAPRLLQQADYIRLLAVGLTPTEAARVLFHGDGRVGKWHADQPEFSLAVAAVRRLNPPAVRRRREHRFTPHRVRVFLDALRTGMSAKGAAEEAGITSAVIYQRRRRDSHFAKLMDDARLEAGYQPPAPGKPIGEEQWERMFAELKRGKTIPRAARDAGIDPSTVYKKRHRDPAFRQRTNRFRNRKD